MRVAPLAAFALIVLQGPAASVRDDGQWTMPGKDYSATRFSGLSQITPRNAARLRPIWSFATGVLGGHEGQPLVVGNTMYVVTPFPNVLYAFDLTREGYPLKWKYRPDVNPTSVGIACCDAINRGAVYADGKIIYNLLDGHTVAVDAKSGQELWKTQIADMNQGETTPMAPFVAGNRVLARRPRDGALVWAYQFTPHDSWDYDSNAEMILADFVVGGRLRKVLVHFDKNGFAYTLDRATGEVLVAEPFAHVTWAKRIDRTTGLPVVDTTKTTGASQGNVQGICPSLEGGKSPASPPAYSPHTERFYTATNNLCMSYQAVPVTRIPGTPYIGATTPYTAGPGGNMGSFIAWDAARGRKVWEIKEKFPVWSGSVVTSGDVAFYGTLDGWFQAADARTGRQPWKFKVGSGVVGAPISFRGADGKQYVAIYAGIGGDWFLLSGDVRSDDPADVRPPADFAPDLARHTSQGGIVWVFGL